MRILQVIPYFPPADAFGGPTKVAYQISRELSKRGHEVVVYTSDAKDPTSRLARHCSTKIDRIRVHYFRNIAMILVKDYRLFVTPELISRAISETREFDVIHLHEYTTFQNIIMAHFARKYGVPYVLQTHGSLPRIMGKEKLKLIYDIVFGYRLIRDASKVIALTEAEALDCRELSLSKDNVAVIPNGLDLSEFKTLPRKGTFKTKYGVNKDEKIILYLGRIHEIKGIDSLVKAYAILVKKGKVGSVRLVIVGPDDGFLHELEILIKTLQIEDKVIILGPLYGKDKLEAYVDADLYALPSRYETFPMSVLEAFACGKPVVASNVGALPSLVKDGVSGFLVKPGDITMLANSIFILINDDDKARQMGIRGRKFIVDNFAIEKAVDRFELIYRNALRSGTLKSTQESSVLG